MFKLFLLFLCFSAVTVCCGTSVSGPKPSSFKTFVKGLRHDLDHIKTILGHKFSDIYEHAEQVLDAIDHTIDNQESLQKKDMYEPAVQKKLQELNREALATLAYFQEIMDVLQQAIDTGADSLKPYTQTEQKRLLVTAPHEIKTSKETKKKVRLPQQDDLTQKALENPNYSPAKDPFYNEDDQ
jgi:hypothetical protein